MKLFASISLAIVVNPVSVLSLVLDYKEAADFQIVSLPSEAAAAECTSIYGLSPFLRSYNGPKTDHFYTTNVTEVEHAIIKHGYRPEGTTCKVWGGPQVFYPTTPLYRLYNGGMGNHFYTISIPEKANAITHLGYKEEALAGYVFLDPTPGTVPLFRMFSDTGKNHFYTTSVDEAADAMGNLGYYFEGIAGYVCPA